MIITLITFFLKFSTFSFLFLSLGPIILSSVSSPTTAKAVSNWRSFTPHLMARDKYTHALKKKSPSYSLYNPQAGSI